MKTIRYKYCNRANIGTEDAPVWHETLVGKAIPYSEINEEIAKHEAYNGEYTIEDDGQQEAQPTAAERIADLEAALELLLSGVTE